METRAEPAKLAGASHDTISKTKLVSEHADNVATNTKVETKETPRQPST